MKVAGQLLPALSTAVQVTVVTPSLNVEPLGGVHVTGTDPSTTSIAVGGVYVTVAPAALVALALIFEGTPIMEGQVVERT